MFQNLSNFLSLFTSDPNTTIPPKKNLLSPKTLLDLPADLIIHILSNLTYRDLKTTFLISSRFGKLLNNKKICELITKKFSETCGHINSYGTHCYSTAMVYDDKQLVSCHMGDLYLHKFPDGS